ncbi:MAG: DUF2079 domain-containing protein [Chloroflexota bacterium]
MRDWLAQRAYLTRAPFIVVLVGVMGFTALFSVMQFKLYDGFLMGLRDLAFNEQALENTLKGNPYRVRVGYTVNTANSLVQYNGWEERSLFTEHVYLLLGLWLPPYALFRSPYLLFIAQALSIGLCAVPLYLRARRMIHHEWVAALIALLFLLHPAAQIGSLGMYVYGPHLDNLAPLFLLCMLYFAAVRRPRAFWLMGLLALGTVETTALTVAAIGLYLAVAQHDWRRHGFGMLAVAVAFFLCATLVIIPWAWGGSARPAYYFAALQAVPMLARNPDLLQPIGDALLKLASGVTMPLGVIAAVANPVAWLIALPELLTSVLALLVGYTLPIELGSWHVWPYLIAAFVATIHFFRWLSVRVSARWLSVAALTLLPISLFSIVWYGPFPFSRDVWPQAYDGNPTKLALVTRAQSEIPYDASLSVEFFLGSHFANRPNVYWFPVNWRDADYVLVDEGAWAWWSDDDTQALRRIQRSGNLDAVWRQERVYLFKRKPAPPMTPLPVVTFGDNIELLGYQLDADVVTPGTTLNLTLFWRAKQSIPVNLTVFNHMTDATGKTVAQKDNAPDNGTYSTVEWTAGEVVVDRYRIRLPDTVAVGAYQIETGLYDSQMGRRATTPDAADHVVLTTIRVTR